MTTKKTHQQAPLGSASGRQAHTSPLVVRSRTPTAKEFARPQNREKPFPLLYTVGVGFGPIKTQRVETSLFVFNFEFQFAPPKPYNVRFIFSPRAIFFTAPLFYFAPQIEHAWDGNNLN